MQHDLSLADLGVANARPGLDETTYWRATFMGGVNSTTVLFDGEPEDRAIQELLVRFGHTTAHIVPPARRVDVAPEAGDMATTDGLGAAREFSGIDTAPEDPRHVDQLIDHIAHLDADQIRRIKRAIAEW